MTSIADALRAVSVRMWRAVEDGNRERTVDADDLIEVLLALADEIDPPVRGGTDPAVIANLSSAGR